MLTGARKNFSIITDQNTMTIEFFNANFSDELIQKTVEAQITPLNLDLGQHAEIEIQGNDGLIYTFPLYRQK